MPAALRLIDLPVEHVPRELNLAIERVPAGFPSPAADDLQEPIDLGAWLVENPAASYVMRVEGYSMTGADISDGDLIVVSRAVRPCPGHIVVAIVHGERTLKRLQRRGNRFWLVPEAEGYEDIEVDEYVEIWGVVACSVAKIGGWR